MKTKKIILCVSLLMGGCISNSVFAARIYNHTNYMMDYTIEKPILCFAEYGLEGYIDLPPGSKSASIDENACVRLMDMALMDISPNWDTEGGNYLSIRCSGAYEISLKLYNSNHSQIDDAYISLPSNTSSSKECKYV